MFVYCCAQSICDLTNRCRDNDVNCYLHLHHSISNIKEITSKNGKRLMGKHPRTIENQMQRIDGHIVDGQVSAWNKTHTGMNQSWTVYAKPSRIRIRLAICRIRYTADTAHVEKIALIFKHISGILDIRYVRYKNVFSRIPFLLYGCRIRSNPGMNSKRQCQKMKENIMCQIKMNRPQGGSFLYRWWPFL